jgi:hypothetical protein
MQQQESGGQVRWCHTCTDCTPEYCTSNVQDKSDTVWSQNLKQPYLGAIGRHPQAAVLEAAAAAEQATRCPVDPLPTHAAPDLPS